MWNIYTQALVGAILAASFLILHLFIKIILFTYILQPIYGVFLLYFFIYFPLYGKKETMHY